MIAADRYPARDLADEDVGSGFSAGGPLAPLPILPPPLRGKDTGRGDRCGTLLLQLEPKSSPELVWKFANDHRLFSSANCAAGEDACVIETRERGLGDGVERSKSHRKSSTAAARSFRDFASGFTGRRLRTNFRGSFSPRPCLLPDARPAEGGDESEGPDEVARGLIEATSPEIILELPCPASAVSASSPTILSRRFASSSGCASAHIVKNCAKPASVRAGTDGRTERGRGRRCREAAYVFRPGARFTKLEYELERGNTGDDGLIEDTDDDEGDLGRKSASRGDGGTR